MANRNRTEIANRNQKDSTTSPQLLSSNRQQIKEKNDDLIVSLAERYENRRARQVGEWERLYGQNVYRTF